MLSPKRRPLNPPTSALARALEAESAASKTPGPLTRLVYAAVDTIADQRDIITESLLTFLDTDALCYYAENPDLYTRQTTLIEPIIQAISQRFDAHIKTTRGLMPLSQSEELEKRMRGSLQAMSDYRLSAVLTLTQLAGSLLLAVAISERLTNDETYLQMAWLEEDFQRERNGIDEEDHTRRQAKQSEAETALMLLNLLS